MAAALTRRAIAFGATLLAIGLPLLPAQSVPAEPEIRQIVTFRFAPGRSAEAIRIYREQLKPIYQTIPALERLRGYSEVESPEPLDLIVVSSYRAMAGMDRANQDLRKPAPNGQTALALYGLLSAMTDSHHDQFVEVIPTLSDSTIAGGLTVFEYLRLLPGQEARFESLVAQQIRPLERRDGLSIWSTTGRMLVSDSWNYLRIHGIGSLGDWQRYRSGLDRTSRRSGFGGLIVARKTIIVREVPEIGVR